MGSRVCEQCLMQHPPPPHKGPLSRLCTDQNTRNSKYCVLDEGILAHYDNELDFVSNRPPRGLLNIFDFVLQPSGGDVDFLLVCGDGWMDRDAMTFRTNSKADRIEWEEAVQSQLAYIRRYGNATDGIDASIKEAVIQQADAALSSYKGNPTDSSRLSLSRSLLSEARSSADDGAPDFTRDSITCITGGEVAFSKDKCCKLCSLKFGMTHRRHHCRVCGHRCVVCKCPYQTPVW